jgi:carbamoyltransferase
MPPVTAILGISAFYHDSAACLVIDGEIVAAAQEERFTRKKHDPGFPANACRYCLAEAGLTVGDLALVGFYEKPLTKFDRLLDTYLDYAPKGWRSFIQAIPLWMKERLWMGDAIRLELARLAEPDDPKAAKKLAKTLPWKVMFGDHHESHAASAFYPSPFEEAAVVTVDGVGEWATASLGVGRGADLELLKELRFPDSLGLLYSALTYFTGFKVNSGEYKVMGLAPYGEPRYLPLLRDSAARICDDGSIHMDQSFFNYCQGLTMTGDRFAEAVGGPPREPESTLTQREMDLARSVQDFTEEAMLKLARFAHAETGLKHLAMAGGVALNCVANGRLLREGPFDEIWIQPAAGDAGDAVAVALALWHRYLGKPRASAERTGAWVSNEAWRAGHGGGGLPPYQDGMKGAYLGPAFPVASIERYLNDGKLPYRRVDRADLPGVVADLLASGKVVGLHQGRMEFGPRALGARSIMGDARSPKMQSVMNLKIKYRESFRPFAPSVLCEHVHEWFELDRDSPYMLLVANVQPGHRRAMTSDQERLWGIEKLNVPRSSIPAVTHVDYSARVQTVRRETNPLYWEIIEAFRCRTGCAVIVNTSFNVRGEPIVCSPEDSYRCFMRTEMDALVLEECLLLKENQPRFEDRENWRDHFTLD